MLELNELNDQDLEIQAGAWSATAVKDTVGGLVAFIGWGMNMAVKYGENMPEWVGQVGDALSGAGLLIVVL